ncbi:MAG: hypothetical protein B7Y90_11575 [Alphaproteobacteria bacterium 32-64-14]|nr:MAG: hypothetical protein B7Y90_11575 [Alphaproteobacteria bacterium 32-64-14]
MGLTRMKITTGLAAITFALAASIAASASAGPPTPEARREIDRLLDVVTSDPPVGETRYVTIKAGEVLTLPFEADATVEYYVNIICDDDCVNVDLAALEADGTEADIDDADDNAPVLNLHAAEYRSPLDKPTGLPRPMTIEIRMKACNADACTLGLRITRVEDWKAGEDEES